MRVHIISEMEGISGIVKPEQVDGGDPMFLEARTLYTEEINVAVRGAKAAGATEVVVMDCHGAGGGWTFNSLIAADLHPDCAWVVQERWTGYTELLEQGCDAALLVGMHARAGTRLGNLNHTVSGRDFQRVWFNDREGVPPYHPGSPCEIRVEFKRTPPADRLRFHPGVERLDGRTIRVQAQTWWEAWKLFFFET